MEENYYLLDPNARTELSRLLRQDVILTQYISGLLPGNIEPSSLQSILDIGCGPGGWLLEIARRWGHFQHVCGLDVSQKMVEAAQRVAELEHLKATFVQGSFTHLPFENNTFDFVNARLVQWFIDQADRKRVLQEWYRVVQPGGWIRLIEAELPQTNSLASEILASLFLTLLNRSTKTAIASTTPEKLRPILEKLSQNHPLSSRNHNIVLLLRQQLEQLGCININIDAQVLDYSAKAPAHDAFVQDLLLAQQSYRDAILQMMPDLTAAELDTLNAQNAQDMQSPDFLGIEFFLVAWGQKPQ